MLLFRNAASAARPIAGVAAAARAAAVLAEEGAREMWIALEAGDSLTRATLDDLRRACPHIVFHFGTGDSVPAIHGEEIIPPGSDGEAARQVLRETAKPTDGIVSKHLNRPVSRLLSSFLLQFPGFRPIHATLGTAVIAVAMGLALIFGGRHGLVWGGLLFHFASIFDGVDGEVARATYRTSERGALLDSIVDMVTNLLFYLGITVSLTHLYGPKQAMVGGWAVAAGLTGVLILGWLVRQLGEPGNFDLLKRFYRERLHSGFPRLVVEAFVTITSRDFFAFGSAVLILVGLPKLVTLGLAIFASLWVILVLIALPPMMRSAGRAAAARLALEQGPRLP